MEDEAGFDLYDGADGHEREAVQPPMELSDDVLALLASFDVDPVRGAGTSAVSHSRTCTV